jgi:hypothetical protein
MRVRRIVRPEEDYAQCSYPKEALKEVGWKGYRERRSQQNGKNPSTCMREASWEVGGRKLCAQHAGMTALEFLEAQE